jgi:sodium-dependent dicarboxylate transporter 2/3/5
MLPVATPPNAIVFGSGYVSVPQMLRAGVWLDVCGVAVIVGTVYWLTSSVFAL